MSHVYTDPHGQVRTAWGRGASFGRGPSGRVRNMRAMTDPKLLAVEDVLRCISNDPQALAKAQSALMERGYRFDGQRWRSGAGVPMTRASYIRAVAPEVRREDFADEDEWLLAALAAG